MRACVCVRVCMGAIARVCVREREREREREHKLPFLSSLSNNHTGWLSVNTNNKVPSFLLDGMIGGQWKLKGMKNICRKQQMGF